MRNITVLALYYLIWTTCALLSRNLRTQQIKISLRFGKWSFLKSIRKSLLDNLTQLVDRGSLIIYSAYNSLQRQLAFVKSPQYYYAFEYRGTFSYGYIFSPSRSTEYRGIVHGDDLIYLFGSQGERLTPPGTEFSENDLIMVDKMVELWSSFIINGTLTMPKTDSTITWEPYSSLKNYRYNLIQLWKLNTTCSRSECCFGINSWRLRLHKVHHDIYCKYYRFESVFILILSTWIHFILYS